MNQIRTAKDIKSLGRIMGIWAHPDDETFTSAAIMAMAVRNRQKVLCITATRGEAGVQDEARWPQEHLATIREKELEKALKIIGVKEHHWLSYQDGLCCEADTDEAVECLCDHIVKFKPATILTFGPDGMTGHPDHQTVSTWATKACARLEVKPQIFHCVQTKKQYKESLEDLDKKLNIFFNIRHPHLVKNEECAILLELDDTTKDIKYRALKAMPSQTDRMLQSFTKEEICRALSPEAFLRLEG